MAKSELKLKARKLRRSGISINKIAKKLTVSKSSVSIWTRDIFLSEGQLDKLRKSMVKGAEIGRLKSVLVKKEKKLMLIETSRENGIKALSKLSDREVLIAGLGLYWGEGSRKGNEFSFCNSDPEMVKFFVFWLKKYFGVQLANLKCRIEINEIHSDRNKVVIDYWSRVLGIKDSQFTKTGFKKAKNRKVYENFNDHYGTLRIRVKRPGQLYYKVIGLIEGLKSNKPA